MLSTGQTVWCRRTVAPVECVVVKLNGTATRLREVETGIEFWARTISILTVPQARATQA